MDKKEFLKNWDNNHNRQHRKMKVNLYQFQGEIDDNDGAFVTSYGYYVHGNKDSFVEVVDYPKEYSTDEDSCVFDVDNNRYLKLIECQTYDDTKEKFSIVDKSFQRRNIAIDVELIDDDTVRVIGGYGNKLHFGADVLKEILI